MIIYKCKNKISDKVYIGKTIHNLEKRKEQHIVASLKKNTIFYNALRSYGIDNFLWEVIYTAKTNEELNEKEIYYITKYDSINAGYNMVVGGNGGYNQYAVDANRKKRSGKTYEEIYTKNGLKIMKEVAKNFGIIGAKYTRSLSKEKLSEIGKHRNKIRTLMGYAHSDETKQKIRDAQIGVTFEDRYSKVEADLLRKKISKATKEGMKNVDKELLGKKSVEARTPYWNKKHEEDRNKIIELQNKQYKVKHICAKLDISIPTYYARVAEINNKNK
jgi:group I intron endonuclease